MRQLWQLSPLRWRLGELRTNELCLWELRHHVAKHSYASYFTGLWWLLMPSEKAEERRWRNHLLPKKLTSAFLLDGPQLTPLSHCVTTRSYGPSILSSACPGRASSCWLTRQRAWIVLRKDSNSAAKRSRVRSNVPTRRYGIRHNMLRSFWSFLVPPHVLSPFLCFSGVKSLTSFAWARKADVDFHCCSAAEGENDRYDCFQSTSPDPHYNMTTPTEELSLSKICDTHKIIKKK